MPHNQRNIGLDYLRIFAALSVLVYHYLPFSLPHDAWLLRITVYLGGFGVDCFFVLSGFLVARAVFSKNQDFSALLFFFNRWSRTLPTYWICLLGFALLSPYQNVPYGDYLLFLQTPHLIEKASFTIMPVSWTLNIEEWFYLAFGLILMASSRHILVIIIAAVILLSPVLRSYQTDLAMINFAIIYRMDGIAWGVAFYLFANKIPALPLLKLGSFWLLTSFVFFLLNVFVLEQKATSLILIIDPVLKSLGFGLIVLWLDRQPNIFQTQYHKQIAFISLATYPFYLVHLDIIRLISSAAPKILTIPLSLSLSCLIAFLLTQFIEMPLKDLRQRLRQNLISRH